METEDIDRTHIIAIQEKNGLFKNVELPISRPEQFIAELKAMIDNPNRTVWDMQSSFTTRFPKTESYLDYIHPHLYDSSFVGGIYYPSLFEYDDLRRSWTEAGNAARKPYLSICDSDGQNPDIDIANQAEAKAIADLKRLQKGNFFGIAMRWIDASCYYETVRKISRDSSVRVFSKESVGWHGFTHRVNDDIEVALKTNFGYGNAAYFLLAVQYKGLDILPYSYIVRYYKANMADIVRCTRSYYPCRESWLASFDFLSDFVNNSVADPESFVESYIMREVTEMMQGLEAIAINPKAVIERIGDSKPEPCVVNVRPMFGTDKTRMQSYPDEMPILFKVEKIVGALDFLESLTEIAKEVKMVQPHIDRLLELNLELYPEVQDAVDKVSNKVGEQEKIKNSLEEQISSLAEKLAPVEAEIAQLRAKSTNENPFCMSNYESAHPEYLKMKREKRELISRLDKVTRFINDFNSFLKILNRSLSIIEKIKQSVPAA